jgi:anti-repressor protein
MGDTYMSIQTISTNLNSNSIILRDLWKALELVEKYSEWASRWIAKYTQGVDYIEVQVNRNFNNVLLKDYAITIEMAKNVALMSDTAKGQEYRTLLIQLESKVKANIPTTFAEALRLAADLEEKKVLLEQKIEQDAPKVQFAEDVEQSEDAVLIGTLAKVFGIKPRSMFELLRQEGYLDKKNIPYQRYIIQGLFTVKETPYKTNEGIKINMTPMITGKGQLYFHRKFFNG